MAMNACATGCGRPVKARGLCLPCYKVARRRGDIASSRPPPPLEDVFWSRVNKNGPTQPHMDTPCWEWTGAKDGHYGYGHVWHQSQKVGWAHRLAWEFTSGAVPAGLFVLHRCDNPACVRAEPGGGHLFLGTVADNAADMIAKGRGIWQRDDDANRTWRESISRNSSPSPPRGEAHPRAKLTDDAVRDIRARRQEGVTLKELAAKHGVSVFAVCRAARGNRWAHVA